MKIDYKHRQSAHCENGATAGLITHHGIEISEAMTFGIGAGLFFGYIPFIRLNHLPLTTFRVATGSIFKRVTKELGITIKTRKFSNQQQAMDVLDETIARGIPVGLQTGAWWLPYFPDAYRFHFNMHNLVVFGKKDNSYLISDSVFPEPVVCAVDDLRKARFAKGALAPKGKMYYLSEVPDRIDMPKAIINGIKTVTKAMLKYPLPIIGVSGIRFLARRVESWPIKLGHEKALLYLGQLIRMQEEIGTGGAGFRFIYAAFLQEAAVHLANDRFIEFSERMTLIGDRWREFAVRAARNCKGRAGNEDSYPAMANILMEIADLEEGLYRELAEAVA
ncbi:MAG: BtrH N-terminal domain-containing protein [Proteobacteria bacterium]|nr:BtrH N-terminal domain-containing protein [Pseudomonadota bacterium]MBU1716742.1 BtrH N-terminal domain-containing protein [Pseudomonadota bacterium]